MRAILFLARRYLSAPSRRGVRLVLGLAVLGMMLGVATLALTQSVLSGFESVFRESILGFNAHLVVLKKGEIDQPVLESEKIFRFLKGEQRASTPFLYRESLLVANGKVKGVVLKGIDPLTFHKVYAVDLSPLTASEKSNDSLKGLFRAAGEFPPLVLGADLAEELGIRGTHQPVKVFLPHRFESHGAGVQSFQSFTVVGTFSTGLYEYDHGFALLDLPVLQKIFEAEGRITGFEMILQHPAQAEKIAKRLGEWLNGEIPQYETLSWQRLNAPLFRALQLERMIFFVIISMVVLVAAFNIVGVLLLMIFDKTREISILRVLGFSQRQMKAVFGIQGVTLGCMGCVLGVMAGFSFAWLLRETQGFKLAKEVYLVETLPIRLSLPVAWGVGAVSLLIALGATQIAVARLRRAPLDL